MLSPGPTPAGVSRSGTFRPGGTGASAEERISTCGARAETSYRPPAIITLAADENHGGLAIRLQPFGVISGIVLDEDGDPVAGVQVSALTPGFQRRRRTLMHRSETMTDNRGRYRLNTLAPGRYAVVVRHMFRPVLRAQRNPRQARAHRHTRMAPSITQG